MGRAIHPVAKSPPRAPPARRELLLKLGDRVFCADPGPCYGGALRVFVVVVALCASVFAGCATAPMYRPVSPPLDDKSFEAGAGVHGVVGQDVGGVGTSAWMQGQVSRDVMIVARGHFTDLFPYRGGGLFADTQFGGAAGLRGTYRISEDLIMGGEALADYQQLSSSVAGQTDYFVSGIAGFPVAERALPNVWVYVEPQLGAGLRFRTDAKGEAVQPEAPFSGFLECPIGVVWQPNDWSLLVFEGGFAIPFTGGYGGVAAAFRL